jgi:uncharacterized protein YdaL
MDGFKKETPAISRQHFFELNIKELVLNGFQLNNRNAISESIEIELKKLFANPEPGIHFNENISLRNLDAGNFSVRTNSANEEIGKQAANSIYGSILKSTNNIV